MNINYKKIRTGMIYLSTVLFIFSTANTTFGKSNQHKVEKALTAGKQLAPLAISNFVLRWLMPVAARSVACGCTTGTLASIR